MPFVPDFPATKDIIRFPNSSLRIKLTDNADEDFLVDRQLLLAHCPTLEPVLRHPGEPGYLAVWDQSTMMKVDGVEDEIRVTTLALSAVDGTYLLSGSDLHSPPEAAFYPQFRMSELADIEWAAVKRDDYSSQCTARTTSARQHLLLFQILHGIHKPIVLDRCDAFIESFEFETLLGMCSLAGYYGCLTFVVQRITKMLTDWPRLWEDVARGPSTYMRFAAKLEWKEMYFDAMRHIMANTVQDGWVQELADHLRMPVEELQEHNKKLLTCQAETVSRLDRSLERLKLSPSYGEFGGQKHPVRITYANQLQHEWEGRPRRVSRLQASRFLACSIYSQWMAEHKVGERIVMEGRRKAKKSGPFSFAVWRLDQAAKWHNPAALFCAEAPEQIMSSLGLGQEAHAIEEVRKELCEIVLAASSHIKLAFVGYDDEIEGSRVTYRRARCDKAHRSACEEGYFTYLPVDEANLPWATSEKKGEFWEAAIDELDLPGEAERLVWEKNPEGGETASGPESLSSLSLDSTESQDLW